MLDFKKIQNKYKRLNSELSESQKEIVSSIIQDIEQGVQINVQEGSYNYKIKSEYIKVLKDNFVSSFNSGINEYLKELKKQGFKVELYGYAGKPLFQSGEQENLVRKITIKWN